MNNTIESAILRNATTPKSATALALSVGKSKAYMIQNELDALVSRGELEADNSGKYTTYKAVSRRVTVSNTAAAQENTVVADTVAPAREAIPAGYSVSKMVVRKSDKKKGHQITLPGSTAQNPKKIFVENGYSLVVINGEAIKCVKTPTSAIKVIQDYASEHGMSPYIVRQTMTGTVGKVDDIQSFSGIIDLKVEKNNKAAV